MQKQREDSSITIPVSNYKEIAIGTLQSIIRQSELAKSLFESRENQKEKAEETIKYPFPSI